MAGLLASVAVKLGLDKLSSFLRASLTSPPTASSSSSLAMQDDLEDLSRLERTMRRILAMLQYAEEHWNIREESAKLRIEELKEVAYDAEDVVDEYEYEVKLEALERSAGVPSSNNKRKRHEGNETDAIDTGTVAILNELVVRARQIIIENYKSQKYPNWLGYASFYNLTKIVLRGSRCQHVPTLGELPFLKSLSLEDMYCVQQIGREFCSHAPGMKGFPLLTRLEFHDLYEWSEWSGVDDGDFACLRTLLISSACQLRSLPSAPFPSLVPWSTLRELCITWCDGLNELPNLPSLLKLELRDCPNLSAVTTLNLMFRHSVPKHEMLRRLLNYHPSLECVTIISDTSTCIPLNPQGLPSLRKLRLSCPNLQYCDGLAGLTSLKELKVWGCRNLPVHRLLPRQLQNLVIRDVRAWSFEDFDQ